MYPLIAFIVTSLVNIALAALVVRRNKHSATHQLFGALTLAFALWSAINYFSFTTSDITVALWLIRLVMALAVVQSLFFMLLLITYPRVTVPLSYKTLSLIFSSAIIGVIVAFSPVLVVNITSVVGKAPIPDFGFGLVVFLPVIVGFLATGVFWLVKKNIATQGIEKIRQRYLLFGLLITFVLLASLVLLFAIVLKKTSFVPFSPFFTLPFVGLTAYTIIRHRLMDIRAAIARSLSLSFLVGTFLLIYGAIFVFTITPLSVRLGVPEGILAAVGALLAVVLARYAQEILRRLTDRFLFQKQVDYRRALVEVGKELSGTIKISDVTNTILKAAREIIRSEKTVIFLKRLQGTDFVPVAADGAGEIKVAIPLSHALIKHLEHTGSPLVKDELALQREQEQEEQHAREIEKVEQTFAWLDIAVVVPLSVNNQFTGLIALGNKLAGTPYMQEDLNFLSALAPQAATALENAQLYKESLEFGEKLKLEVERATHELAAANDQLRDLDKAKSEFLSVANHQLYTPLTPIRGYLSMLLEGEYGPIASRQKPIIKMLEISASRLITLVKNYLDISRIESGRLELNLESVDLAQMADELVKEMLPNALKKKLKLVFAKPAEAVPHVVADRDRIRQVMMNFIDNAIKYTDKGRVDVHLRLLGQEVLYYVTDTGRGIDRTGLARLFNKFSRVGNSTRLRTEGTGLGLYVAKQIVKEHHGDVEVDSAGEGKGSTFSVRLPAEGSARSLTAGVQVSVDIKSG